MNERITIREYGAFCIRTKDELWRGGCRALKPSTFELLERFALENSKEDDNTLEIVRLSSKRGVGKIITVKNYVGVIALTDGTVIEILPKTSASESEVEARRLLAKMLTALRNAPYKHLQMAKLDVCDMNILEVFIRMFIDEVRQLTKEGIKSSYETLEDDLPSLRGKLNLTKQIRHNALHKERFYTSFDEFTVNRPENRLLKSTLAYLLAQTRSIHNKKDLKGLLSLFEEVSPSTNYDADFSKIVPDRNTKSYQTALSYAKVFLKGKSFASFSGSTVAMALLFPMEVLFQDYVALLLKRLLSGKPYVVSTQDTGYYLFDLPKKQFSLRPDVVITGQKGEVLIVDTKWKVLDSSQRNLGISQGDMYQMYAYHKKYESNGRVVLGVSLLYPMPFSPIKATAFSDLDGVRVSASFVDLTAAEKSLSVFLREHLTLLV